MGWATDQTLPARHLLPPRAYNLRWDRLLAASMRDYLEQTQVSKKNPFDALSPEAFTKGEAGMKIDKTGNGSFAFDLHGPSPSSAPKSGRIQSPAQHASVKKAAQASVAKRRSRSFGI